MIKTKLSDYKTQKETIEYDGKQVEIEIRSMASREFRDAMAEYIEVIGYAKNNDIPLTQKETKSHGLGIEIDVESATEYQLKAMAILISSLVVEWPFDTDLAQDILDNKEFGNMIDNVGVTLKNEFVARKKS